MVSLFLSQQPLADIMSKPKRKLFLGHPVYRSDIFNQRLTAYYSTGSGMPEQALYTGDSGALIQPENFGDSEAKL